MSVVSNQKNRDPRTVMLHLYRPFVDTFLETMIFLLKFSLIYVLSRDIKDFVMTVTIKSKINTTHTGLSKNLAKFVLWSGLYKMQISVLLIRKT